VLNTSREQEIAASVGAYRDLGGGYDDAIAAGLVERIGAEVDRRVDERVSQYQPAAGGAGRRDARRRAAAHPGSPISWQQTILAFASMVIGAIASGVALGHQAGFWPVLVIWLAIVVINVGISRAAPFRRFPD
jgi:hypothetical protein